MSRRSPPRPSLPELTFRPQPAATGPYAEFLAQQQANRDVVTNARDLRTGARQRIDRLWDRMVVETKEQFGRSPSTEAWDQPDHGAVVALNHAREAEVVLLHLEHAGAGPAATDAAFNDFCAAVAAWLNAITRRWPPKKVYERQQREAASARYR